MSRLVYFITHADVEIDPNKSVPDWKLSERGIARHQQFNDIAKECNISYIYSSEEQKAVDGARVMADELGIKRFVINGLHENDRSATGYLKSEEFEKTADEFFANPLLSVRGWERAFDAQKRIVSAVNEVIRRSTTMGNIAIISHGGVGTLLLCYLKNEAISRRFDQPGSGGGNYFSFQLDTNALIHDWITIAN